MKGSKCQVHMSSFGNTIFGCAFILCLHALKLVSWMSAKHLATKGCTLCPYDVIALLGQGLCATKVGDGVS